MSSDPQDPKSRILARRAKFMLAAMATSVGTACGSTASTCLEPAIDSGVDAHDAGDTGAPEPCLGAPEDTGPTVCLTAPLDSGSTD